MIRGVLLSLTVALPLAGCATPSDERQGATYCAGRGDAAQWMQGDSARPLRCGPQTESPYSYVD